MTRAMVIGNAGGGKSLLSRAICLAHGLPYHAIDDILWNPGWVRVPETEYRRRHDKIVSGERWLIDGYGTMRSVEDRLKTCDTVIFVDLPIHVHFWWATKRQVKSLFLGRAEGPDGCPMWPVTFRLYTMMWRLHFDMRPKLVETIYAHASSARIIHIKSRSALNAFAANPV